MRKNSIWVPIMILMVVGCVSFTACDDDEGAVKKARHNIVGTWRMIKDGPLDVSRDNVIAEFSSNKNVKFKYNERADNLSQTEYSYSFEHDWVYDEENGLFEGHIRFAYKGGDKDHYDFSDCHCLCGFQDNRMFLMPDRENVNYVKDPTKFFIRVE